MRTIKFTQVVAYVAAISLLALPTFGLAQDDSGGQPPSAPSQQNPAPAGTWQHFANPPQDPGPPDPQNQGDSTAPSSNAPAPVIDVPPGQAAPNPPAPYRSQPNGPENDQQYAPVPSQLTLKAGTFITVRSNQYLSSDRNHPGDAFTATVANPLVVGGFVVAAPGETVGGRVVDAKKAGMVKGVSHLALQLTSLTLVDGQTIPIQTQLSGSNGPHSNGRDAAAVATTTGVGAAVGAAVANPWDVGTGAAIGAGAGAAIGLAGVLLTRGRPTVVYPEGLLTFQIAAPVTISTVSAPEAFRYMDPNAYQASTQGPPPRSGPPCNGYGCAPPPPYYYYGPGYYPYYWGPGLAFWWGPRFYGGWGGYGRGWYGRGWYGGGGFHGRR